MLNLKKVFAIIMVATFLAAIPPAVLSSQSDLAQAVYTITVEGYCAKPSAPLGKDKVTADYKIMLGMRNQHASHIDSAHSQLGRHYSIVFHAGYRNRS